MRPHLFVLFLATGVTLLSKTHDYYKVTIPKNSVVDGKSITAGNYKVQIENGEAILSRGAETTQIPAHMEVEQKKFTSTETTYLDPSTLKQIDIGGTHARIVFD